MSDEREDIVKKFDDIEYEEDIERYEWLVSSSIKRNQIKKIFQTQSVAQSGSNYDNPFSSPIQYIHIKQEETLDFIRGCIRSGSGFHITASVISASNYGVVNGGKF
jgi:hypothetical protein